MVEGQETGDLYRALILEMLHPGFQIRNWESCIHLVEMWSVTDCMDLFDSLKKPGNEIEDRRLRMDIAAMKASVSATNVKIKWASTKQMPADGLTKD